MLTDLVVSAHVMRALEVVVCLFIELQVGFFRASTSAIIVAGQGSSELAGGPDEPEGRVDEFCVEGARVSEPGLVVCGNNRCWCGYRAREQ